MDIHFNGYKVKYSQLNYHMMPVRNSQHLRSINIFIDLDNLFHTLHRPLINYEFQVCGRNASKQFVSNVMNLAGHYRNWALKEHLYPRIYMFYSSATHKFKNNIYIPNYRSRFFDMNDRMNGNYYHINETIRDSYEIMHVICKYINDVYIIDSKYLEPGIVPLYIAENLSKTDWNILISRDIYMLQYGYRDKWTMISPKGDNTSFINKSNIWDYINNKEHVYKDNENHYLNYNPGLFIYAQAIVGDKYRSIPRLKRCGWKTIFNYLDKIQSDDTANDVLEIALTKMTNFIESKHMDLDTINNNLYCIDVERQVSSLLDTDKTIIDNQIEDMADYQALQRVNNDIFREFPLNLNFLCNSVQLI